MQLSQSLGMFPTHASSTVTPPRMARTDHGIGKTTNGQATATSTTTTPALVPFFLMDFLDDLTQNQDLELLAKLLKTPSREDNGRERRDASPTSSVSSAEMMTVSEPKTPKSSNRRNRNKNIHDDFAMSGSASCPALSRRTTSTSSLYAGSQSRDDNISPMKPKKIPFDDIDQQEHFHEADSNAHAHAHTQAQIQAKRRSRPKSPHTLFRKSIALGNAWNAKGLGKAKDGRWEEALGCWENALEIRINMLGRNHVDCASTINNLGIALGKVGRFSDAIDALQQALEIRWYLYQQHQEQQKQQQANSIGGGCEAILSTFHNLSNVYEQADQPLEALRVLQQARQVGQTYDSTSKMLETNQSVSSSSLPKARINVALGHLYLVQLNDPEKALVILEEARNLFVLERDYQKELLVSVQQQSQSQRNNSKDENSFMSKQPNSNRPRVIYPHQQKQQSSNSRHHMCVQEDTITGMILICQQELLDVERDLKDLQHLLNSR